MQKGIGALQREIGAHHLRTLRSHLTLAEILDGYGKPREAQEHYEAFLKPQIGDLGKIGGAVTPRPLPLIDEREAVGISCSNYGMCAKVEKIHRSRTLLLGLISSGAASTLQVTPY